MKSGTTTRVAIVGAGHVGATAAYALMLRALVSEIVLIDSNTALAKAEAAECVRKLANVGFAGVNLVAANPVDVMVQVAFRGTGLPANLVIGTGTLLDPGRLRQALVAKLELAPSAVEGLVLGEHGDSEVAAFSTVRGGGLALDRFAEYAVLPVSTLMAGPFEIDYVLLSLPCVLGKRWCRARADPTSYRHRRGGAACFSRRDPPSRRQPRFSTAIARAATVLLSSTIVANASRSVRVSLAS